MRARKVRDTSTDCGAPAGVGAPQSPVQASNSAVVTGRCSLSERVAASATMGERELAANLARAAGVVGMPVMGEGKLTYALMPAVGQGVILYGKSLLLLKAGDPSR